MKEVQAKIRFHGCKAGWIDFTIAVGRQTAKISASNLWDPFPDMICWLERIAAGRRHSLFAIDEEGVTAQFVATAEARDSLRLVVRDPERDVPPQIEAVVDRRQFVTAIYTGFVRFAKSKRYVEEEWAAISLGDRLAKRLPDLTAKQILADLARLDRDTLGKLFFKVAPSYLITFKGTRTAKQKVGRFVDFILHPNSRKAKQGLIQTPDEWEIPGDFDNWPVNRRKKCLREMLKEQANSWSGVKLDELSSPRIERYLACSEHPRSRR